MRRHHIEILSTLVANGPTRAVFFEEDLFKKRPRLIELVRGNVNAVVDITPEGRSELIRETRTRAGTREKLSLKG
jgi:hypothetical protein